MFTLNGIRRQADLQERGIRPWVGTTEINRGTIISGFNNKPQISARLTLHKSGPSVALKGFMLPFLIASKHDILPKAIKSSWEMMETVLKSNAEWNTGFVLHPGQSHHQNASMGTDIPVAEVNNGICYILVCVVYRDQFDRSHKTQDCFRVIPDLQTIDVRFEVVPAYQMAD